MTCWGPGDRPPPHEDNPIKQGQPASSQGELSMKTRAAVALEAGKPLEVMEVNLEGPKAGEVMVEIKATGICHT
ncbi:hypothetical protein IT41_05890, partial [Paracoccus halophilus]